MNKIYRIVWNEARGAFIVAHEKSKANGKPSSTRKAIASAVVMALAAMAAEPALAACTTTTAIGCTWTGGNISNAVTYGGTYTGIKVNPGSNVSGSITNSGTISTANAGIYIYGFGAASTVTSLTAAISHPITVFG